MLEIEDDPGFELTIWDIYGTVVEKVTVSPGKANTTVDVNDYPAGIYVLEIKADGIMIGETKFAVKH